MGYIDAARHVVVRTDGGDEEGLGRANEATQIRVENCTMLKR